MNPGSKIYEVYERLPAPLQSALVTVYGHVLRRRRYGREHDRTLREITESQNWNLEAVRELQWAKLRAVVENAYENVEHYRELWTSIGFHPDDLTSRSVFEELPTTEKQAVKEDPWRFVTDHYRRNRQGLTVGHTSGTTGMAMILVKNRAAHQRTWAFLERMRRSWSIDRSRPRASLLNRPVVPPEREVPPFWRYNHADKQWMFSNLHLHQRYLSHYLDKLVEIQPEEIVTFPSGLNVLAAFALAKGEDRVRPRAVITTAETLTAQVRENIERAFGPVADHYGTGELVVWVCQCPRGTYHINHEFSFFETLQDGRPVRGVPGNVVATGFVNEAQVLVRYEVGDVATVSNREGECPCGWKTEHLQSFEGRVDDTLFAPDGRAVGRIDPVARNLSGVRECQVVQDARDHLIVRLVAETQPLPEVETTVRERLVTFFGPEMRTDFHWVDEIPRSRAGKYRFQINEIAGRDR